MRIPGSERRSAVGQIGVSLKSWPRQVQPGLDPESAVSSPWRVLQSSAIAAKCPPEVGEESLPAEPSHDFALSEFVRWERWGGRLVFRCVPATSLSRNRGHVAATASMLRSAAGARCLRSDRCRMKTCWLMPVVNDTPMILNRRCGAAILLGMPFGLVAQFPSSIIGLVLKAFGCH